MICIMILQAAKEGKTLCYYCGPSLEAKANAAVLVGQRSPVGILD